LIKAFHISPATRPDQIQEYLEGGFQHLGSDLIFLLDTKLPGRFGGTGAPFNWEKTLDLPPKYRIIVAGGLTPLNVDRLVRQHNPWGVDVSSGVETDGIKDILKIQDFVRRAKSARGEDNASNHEK
jgi:phosphoribosylanthranilate isomerase